MGLAELLLGKSNPFSQFVASNRNAIRGVGAGLGQGRNFGEGLGLGAQYAAEGGRYDDAYATQQKAEAERMAQLNETVQYLQQSHPDLAAMVESGMPLDQAWQTALKRMEPGGGNDATYGLTPIYGVGPDGQPTIAQLSNQGGIQAVDLPEGFQVAKDPIRMDAGTHYVLLDPVTRQQIATIPKEVRAEASEAAGGTVEGRHAAETAIQAPIQEANLMRLDVQTDNVIQTVDKALGQAGAGETGLIGQVMGGVAGTQAFDLRETVKTIKANLGFAELQAMREASPTGGALGQVAVQELEALQSTLASLNADQSREQLLANLATVKQLLERQKMFRRAAAEAKYGLAAPQQAPAGGDIDSILGGYGL